MAGTALRGFATINFWAEDVAAAVIGTPTFSVPRRTSSAPTPPVGSSMPNSAWVIPRPSSALSISASLHPAQPRDRAAR